VRDSTVIYLGDVFSPMIRYRTARSKKAAALREAYKALPSVEIVDVEDIAHDQFGEALKGVDAVIHPASPLPGRDPIEIMLKV